MKKFIVLVAALAALMFVMPQAAQASGSITLDPSTAITSTSVEAEGPTSGITAVAGPAGTFTMSGVALGQTKTMVSWTFIVPDEVPATAFVNMGFTVADLAEATRVGVVGCFSGPLQDKLHEDSGKSGACNLGTGSGRTMTVFASLEASAASAASFNGRLLPFTVSW